MNKTEKLCKQCGKCCHYEIPLTILDIHRIAQFLDESDQYIFEQYIQKDYISEKAGLFAIQKKENRACSFLDEQNRCTIHEAKPRTCEFFICSHLESKEEMPWTAEFNELFEQAKLWEQSIASMVTKAYIKKNNTKWNETDFYKSLLSIYENIKTEDTEKIKLASNGNKCPVGLVYDCTKCSKKGACAEETIITIDDMRRIVSE